MSIRLSADVGGTFTDIVLLDEVTGTSRVTKVPTVTEDIALGVVRGFDDVLAGDYRRVSGIVYGTTAGLNALITRSGPRVALLTTRGFRDVYEIARANHPAMYDVRYRKPAPLVPRSDVVEVTERLDAAGRVEVPLDEESLAAWASGPGRGYDSVAVSFLHSYVDDRHERAAAAVLARELGGDLPLTLSSEIAPELGEYERTSTTVLGAYLSPIIRHYVTRMRQLLTDRGYAGQVLLMQSGGGVLTEELATRQAVRTVMSGPVGGTIGAGVVGRRHGADRVLAVDMGGTSFDVSLITGGRPQISLESEVEGFPVLVPSVQTLSVGAGGGSIAWTEAGGMRVGPRSAGARPGPASYGHGGQEPTTTDANLVAGRIDARRFLGGRMPLDEDAAGEAVARYGRGVGLGSRETAEGILTIVDTTMAAAIRRITLQRGQDPRDFTMLAYGGAGPLHAVALATELGMGKVIVPPDPGTFSAWGMLHAELRHDAVASVNGTLADLTPGEVAHALDRARRRLDAELCALVDASGARHELRSLDLRYAGQKYTVNLELPAGDPHAEPTDAPDLVALRAAFDERYRALYGFSSPGTDVEVVNARVAVLARRRDVPVAPARATDRQGSGDPSGPAPQAPGTPVIDRAGLAVGDHVLGPAVLTELTATTYLPPSWRADVAPDASLVLTHTGAHR